MGDETVPKILQQHLIIGDDPLTALDELLQLPPLKRYYNDRLKTDLEREHFRAHLLRYTYMYSPDAPFEVSTTNRYLVDTHEAAVTARAEISRGEVIRHLTGVQVPLTKDEEKTLDLTRRDFSVVVSARKRTVSLFLGPARFANHDCDANARLRTCGNRGMEVIAVKDIKLGEEITVTYSEDYFGVDNKECLCATCEHFGRNGWADDTTPEPGASQENVHDTEMKSPHSHSATGSGSNSRSPSRPRPGQTTPTRKRKSDTASLESGERSPKRPEVGRVSSDANGKRASSTLSNEIRPQDIPDPSPIVAQSDQVSSPPGLSASISSKSSHADGISSSTAPTSLSEHEHNLNSKYRVERVKPPRTDGDLLNQTTPTPRDEFRRPEPQPRNERGHFESRTPNNPRADKSTTPVNPDQLASRLESASQDIGMPVIAEPTEDVAEFHASTMKNKKLPSTKGRRPGDYTLTGRLLCTPYSRWVQCRVCDSDFVQTDAYQTRFACPRCERHSKLYGYMWPKTEKEGKFDEEERILDHREVNRFVGPQQEKEIKKGKEKALKNLLREREEGVSSSAPDEDEWEDVTPSRGRVFRKSLGKRNFFGREQDVDDLASRRGRSHPSEHVTLSGLESKRRKQQDATIVRSRPTKTKVQYQPLRTKRKYVRSGNFTREAMAKRAAARETMREQLKREKQKRRKQMQQAQKASLGKTNAEAIAIKKPIPKTKLSEDKSTKTTLRPGEKKSKWKGWILVPATDQNEPTSKAYDASGKRIRGDEEPQTPSEPATPSTSSSAKRNTRLKPRTGAPVAVQKRKYVRSGKYVGVAEARRKRQGIPAPNNKPIKVTKAPPRARPQSKPKPRYNEDIKYESPKQSNTIVMPDPRGPSPMTPRVESSGPRYGTPLGSDSASDFTSESRSASWESDFDDESDSEHHFGESEFESSIDDQFTSRRRSEPTRKSARTPKVASSPGVQTETRSARRASGSSKDVVPNPAKPPTEGKLKRVSPVMKRVPPAVKRKGLPKGWVYADSVDEVEPKQEDLSERDMDWEAQVSVVEHARAESAKRRSRKTI